MNHEAMFGKAQWIGCDPENRTPNIRASFDVPVLRTAKITICGLGYFLLYINGQRVSDDLFVPVTSDYVKRPITVNGQPFDEEMNHRCYCLQYDVAPYLKAGRNELAVALGPGFFGQDTGFFDGLRFSFGQVRLCYRLEWAGENGETGEILSGPDARWHESIVTWHTLFRGEVQDLRLCSQSWMTDAYEDWKQVTVLPPLETEYQWQDCPGDRIIRRIAPRLLKETETERLYDAGENISGWVILADESAEGDEIHVRVSEALDQNGDLDEKYRHGQHLDVISDGQHRLVHLQHTWHAFRYFTVQGKARVHSVAVIHSDVPVTSAFSCASPVLNWLYDAYVRTQLCNMHGGIPSDCPHIERRGYTGDGQLACEAALLTLNHHDFLRKWIRDIQDCQDIHSGHVQYTAPYQRCGGGPGGWGCAIATVPYQYYLQYGDTAPIREMYEGMRKYIGYLQAHSENYLVVSDRAGEWCLGDWCPPGTEGPDRTPPKIPQPFVNTYFLIKTLDVIRRVEKVLGKEEDAAWAPLEKESRKALLNAYFDPATGNFCGNVEGANAFALDIQMGDERTFRNLCAHYRETGCYDTGIFGTEIVTRVLLEKGEFDLAFRLLVSEEEISFAGWMQAGSTTLWEYWPRGYQRSLSHPMFGAVVKELFKYVLGIRQEKGSAGWKRALIAPEMTDQLPWAEGKIETPLGEVQVAYQAAEGRLEADIQIPAGMEAVLRWKGREMALKAGKQQVRL